MREFLDMYSGQAKWNTWYPFVEIPQSFYTLCSGIQTFNPQFRIEDGKFVMSTKVLEESKKSNPHS
jgi:hypothetical protein